MIERHNRMTKLWLPLALALAYCFGSLPVAACSIVEPSLATRLSNKRVKSYPDCSFVNRGMYDEGTGEAAKDLGNGRIVQMISGDEAIVADCNAGKSILVFGIENVGLGTSCGPSYDLAKNLKPNGPIDFSAGKDWDALVSALESQNVAFNPDATILNYSAKPRDRINVLCGCEVFYPGSQGAGD